MMKFSYGFILIIIMIIITDKHIQKVSCIKCYQCRSDDESNCDKLEEDSEYLGDCNDSRHSVYCRKIFQKLSFPDYNVLTIIRECAYVHKSATSCYKSPWKDNNVITCECETDGCNKGYSVLRTFPTWIVFLCTCFRVFFLRLFLSDTFL